MTYKLLCTGTLSLLAFWTTGCGAGRGGNDYASNGPATPEPAYFGTPTAFAANDSVRIMMRAKFYYRQTDFTVGFGTNGLGAVVSAGNAAPIPFSEFHIYNSAGNRIQQGETTTNGTADFRIPKTAGTYTIKVFSRALNSYLKVSILNDIYVNAPYSIAQSFSVSASDIANGTLDLTLSPVYAHADETISSGLEGAAFNILFDILLANEYIRRNIEKNGDVANVASSDPNKWWVADKVTVFWKAGFNPSSYIKNSVPLSFYSTGERKLYILGGVNGDVRTSDTDHFDDSVILHEYGHFLEDAYGNSKSPGGSHNGNFVIDPRLAWSEGWATYLSAAILTGTDAFGASPQASESRLPTAKRFQYYLDTYGYKGSGTSGMAASVNLAAVGTSSGEPDNVSSDLAGTGTFREISVARTLYKSSREVAAEYSLGKFGGGLTFKNVWKAFSGEEKNVSTHTNPATYSLSNTATYPLPNIALFNWMISKNGFSETKWDAILTEEKQSKVTRDYAFLLAPGSGCTYTFTTGTPESYMGPGDPAKHSNPQVNNDFYLYYHDGSSVTLGIAYTTSGTVLDLDLILYKTPYYVYFEDTYWYAGQSSSSVVQQSRNPGTSSESISLNSSLPVGYYLLNVKINAYGKISTQLNGSANYTISRNGAQQCGTERP